MARLELLADDEAVPWATPEEDGVDRRAERVLDDEDEPCDACTGVGCREMLGDACCMPELPPGAAGFWA